MPITELALLHLTPGTNLSSPILRANLAHAKTVLQTYTSHPFYYLQQLEDASCVYVIGEWESLDQHMNHFIPSAENQALLQMLKDDITVDSNLEHLGVGNAELPLPVGVETGEKVWGIAHYHVKAGEKEVFLDILEEKKRLLRKGGAEGKVGGGWCVGEEGEKDVFVLVWKWEGVERHEEFGQTEEGKEFEKVGECVEEVDVKLARLLDI
jgi:heme-degrading monooxygenase HmoA